MSKILHREMVAFVLKQLSEADDFVGNGSDLDLKFARNRIRSVRDIIIEHAVDEVPVEGAANEDVR